MHDYDDDAIPTCDDCGHGDDCGGVRYALAFDRYLCDHCLLLRDAEEACSDEPTDEVEAAGRYRPWAATDPGIYRRY